MKISYLLAIYLLFMSCLATAKTQALQTLQPDEFKAQFNKLLEEQNVVGAQLVIFNEHKNTLELNHGFSDLAQEIAVDKNTLFRAGSTTKPFVAMAIMQLIEEGHFSLQSKVSELAPEINIHNPWHETSPIRVVHLLEHTAGFDDMHFKNFYNKKGQEVNLLESVNRDAESLAVRWQPGTRHAYANPGYGILGYLIEKFSNQTFDNYISKNILAPLNMNNAFFGYQQDNSAFSQGFNSGEVIPNYDIFLRPAGNLSISASELAKFGRYFLDSTQHNAIASINSDILAKMQMPHSTLAAKQGLNFGYGLGLYQTERKGHLWVGHNGGVGEFITAFAFSHQLDIGYVLMVNTNSIKYREISDMLMDYLHQNIEPKLQPQSTQINSDITGYYRLHSDRNQIFAGITWPFNAVKVSQQDNELTVSPLIPSESLTLIHLEDNQFIEKGSYIANSIFVEHPEYGKVLVTDGQFWVESSFFMAWLPVVIGLLFVMSLTVTLLYLPIWCVNFFRGKLKNKSQLLIRLLPFCAVASLILLAIAFTQITWLTIADINAATLIIFACTWLFALFSFISLISFYKFKKQEANRFARIFLPMSSMLFSISTVYFAANGYIGLALWAW